MNPVHAYREIYEQFIVEAAFLWVLRSIAVDQPHYSGEDIIVLEKRIEAQLDGLMTAIDLSWELCLEALELEQPGEIFTAAIIAFKSHDVDKIQTVVNAGFSNSETFKGLVSALGWLPGKLVHPWIEKFLTSKDLKHKHLALSACNERQDNPSKHLNRIITREDCQQETALYISALKIAGELKRSDLLPDITAAMDSDQESIQFWATRSRLLLGDRIAINNLEAYVFTIGDFQHEAINLSFRVLPMEQARTWISRLSQDPLQTRAVIKSIGALGDPQAINWLITAMQQQSFSRLAGEVFTAITGVNIEENSLHLPESPDTELIPNNDADDEDIDLDEDENLPWPDVEKVKSYWADHGKSFTAGKRYFLGRVISIESLKQDVMNANQRQRHAAALELALNIPDAPLINTRRRLSAE